ncbi:MAG: hypothetical protein ABI632_14130, partial [Pseudolysinimonas sp.]
AQMETLWDAVLPAEMLALPPDLARLDALCDDAELLAPFRALWLERWPDALGHGRPTVAMETFVPTTGVTTAPRHAGDFTPRARHDDASDRLFPGQVGS